ncbi:MAG: DUF5706 domain-containing protein [Saprospiraceae bacterium]|nr:DUF5706 domain-containing protein [Saprospiraceae bacterium]
MDHIVKATEYVTNFFEKNIDPKYAYHDLDHTLSVLASAKKIAQKSNLEDEKVFIIQIAALFHDTGYIDGPEEHEERSAKIAEDYLLENGFDQAFIDKVKSCIRATKMFTESSDQLSQILQDADISGLASKHFFEITEKLRIEKNNLQEEQISKKEWNKTNIQFLKDCTYKTKVGQELYASKKDKNLSALVSKKDKKTKDKKNKIIEQTIASNKSAQTQFKTALRNHIDLSNIADNKANIMISVNALILTVALPFLIDKSMDNHRFLIPTVIMSIVCLVSMVYATLATRPIKMMGRTSEDQITQNNANLFFFGNYHKMTLEEYQSGVKHVLSDSDALDNSIIRDLFFLGKSLGGKFEFLRLCYNVFMYGIILVVFSLLIVYVI